MGNCCPCVKTEANTRSSVAPGNYPLSPGKVDESDSFNPSRSEELEDSSFIISSEAVVNGSGLESRDAKGEARKPFYVLIPPLVGRGSGSDLKRTNNNTINGALSSTAMGNNSSTAEVSESSLQTLYETYHGNNEGQTEDVIAAEGILNLCADLELPPDDFRILLFAWKCDAVQMGRLSKNEFIRGCRYLGADSVRNLKSSLDLLVKEVENNEAFSDMYRFAFRFALDVECGQRSLPIDVSLTLWRLVFTHRPSSLLHLWVEFLEQIPPPVRAITRDTWLMFLHLVDAVGDDLSRYDDNEAWPSLFDDFVEWANDRANQNVLHAKGDSQ